MHGSPVAGSAASASAGQAVSFLYEQPAFRRMIARIRNWLGRSLTRRFVLLFLAVLAVQIVQLGLGALSDLHQAEESDLINIAGKQRMRLLLMQLQVQKAFGERRWSAADRSWLADAVAQQDGAFARLYAHTQKFHHGYLRGVLDPAHTHWTREIKPPLAAFDPADARAAGAIVARLDARIPEQLVLADRVVQQFEQNSRDDALDLALLQGVMLLLVLPIGVAGLTLIRRGVTRPLRGFIEATEEIAAGAYDRRVAAVSRDELGELGDNFNRMVEAVEERAVQLHALNEAALAVTTSSLSLKDILAEIMRRGILLSGVQASCIAFYDQEVKRFTEWVTHGLSAHFVENMTFRPGGLAEEAFAGSYVLSDDRPQTRHKLSKLVREEGLLSFLCLPLTGHARRLGVICFYRRDRDSFTPAEIELLTTFASLAAGAIENARLYERLASEARTDLLTGLGNRRMFEVRLSEEMQRAQRYGKPFSLALLDIDHFKRVNDTYGHDAGDAVLKSLAVVLTGQVREADFVARYGGEEFMLLMPETDATGARLVTERLRQAVAGRPFRLPNGQEIGLTVSLGIVCFPQSGDGAAEMLQRADQALYSAKRAGRNRVVFYHELLKAEIERNPERVVELLNQSLDNAEAIAAAVDMKSLFLHDHSRCAQDFAVRLGQTLDLPLADVEALGLAGLLHDVGAITLPDALLNKPDAFTQDEWREMRRHPVIAADLLGRVHGLERVAPVVRHHHERYDGGGYPDGLKGERIPYLARVLTVADAWCALLAERPHRRAYDRREATEILTAGAGAQFDPEIVRAFLKMREGEA